MRHIEGVLYCNDGDWVESLTALVEHHDGRLEILDRSNTARVPQTQGAVAPARSPVHVPVPGLQGLEVEVPMTARMRWQPLPDRHAQDH